MGYNFNPQAFGNFFYIPNAVVDNNIRLANELQIKVLLCACRNFSSGINPTNIASALLLPESEVLDALLYWVQAGILLTDTAVVTPVKAEEKAVISAVKSEKPTRNDVAARGMEDAKVRFLFSEAQQRFGRSLKQNEASTLLWLYDDHGMDVSVILLLLQYAVSENRLNISFIEKTALEWLKNDVQSVTDAEKQIADTIRRTTAWHVVESVFGIEKRRPSEKESIYADIWLNEWKFSRDMLKKAYDVCIDAKTKLSVPYIAKVLENWHKSGFTTPQDVDNAQNNETKSANNYAAYDLEAFEKKLNSND